MKKTLALIIIIIITCNIKAQDIMITKDGQKITAKIEEIGTNVIKYKKNDNPTATTYSINKSDVASILFENGDFEVFSQQAQKAQQTQQTHVRETQQFDYQNAKNLYNAGIGLTVGGAFCLGSGITCCILAAYADGVLATQYYSWQYKGYVSGGYSAGAALITIGSVATISGIVCIVIGKKRMNNNGDITLYETHKYKLNMALGGNNMGFKLQF